jgi:peroxiredoxin family protein
MNLAKQAKELQQKQAKEQQDKAMHLVEQANELYKLFEEKGLQVYECGLVIELLGKRVNEKAQNFVGQKKLNELV